VESIDGLREKIAEQRSAKNRENYGGDEAVLQGQQDNDNQETEASGAQFLLQKDAGCSNGPERDTASNPQERQIS
jgi:hypothetical protein